MTPLVNPKAPLRHGFQLAVWILAILLPGGCASQPTKPTGSSTTQVPKETANSTNQEPLRIVVSFPANVHPIPISGRILVFMCHSPDVEPARASLIEDPQPVFGIDVTNLAAETEVVFDPTEFYAFKSAFGELTPGIYYAQALVDLDKFNDGYRNPGNLYSPMLKCQVAEALEGGTLKLVMSQRMPEVPLPKDTQRIKKVELRSSLLSNFFGREIILRAVVILPSGIDDQPNRQFPAVYQIPGSGVNLAHYWGVFERGDTWPEGMLRVVVDAQGPWGHTHLANSANNGPVGDAFVNELIPEIEKRFRAIPQPHARFLRGHSAGGWTALWLQVNYPEFFGGCWSASPDPVDFTAFQNINIYEERNGHWTPDGYPRPLKRANGNVVLTFPQMHKWGYVIGADQVTFFDAVFSPRGLDGKPRPLMDMLTGRIDREVAAHWKNYDILAILRENWPKLGPKLKGKLHITMGAVDSYYLDRAVDNLSDFLKTTDYGGYVEFQAGTHNDYFWKEWRDKINREIAEQFGAGVKAPSQPKP